MMVNGGIKKFGGKTIRACSEEISLRKIVETFSKVTGRKAFFTIMDRDDYIAGVSPYIGPTAAEEMCDMLWYIEGYGYYGGKSITEKSITETKRLVPDLTSWEAFLKKSGWKGPE